jgi:cyanate permease
MAADVRPLVGQLVACVVLAVIGVVLLAGFDRIFGWVFLVCGVGGCVSLGVQVWAETKGKR